MSTNVQGRSPTESAANLQPNQTPRPHSSQPILPSNIPPPPPPPLTLLQPLLEGTALSSQMSSSASVSRMTQSDEVHSAFHARSYSHLPTPQSPNNVARYVLDHPTTPQSPIPTPTQNAGGVATSSSYHKPAVHKHIDNTTPTRAHGSKQCITPDSSFDSPMHGARPSPSHRLSHSAGAPSHSSSNATTPKSLLPSVPLELGLKSPSPLAPSPHISSPVSASSEHSSLLSSPFVAKLAMTERNAKRSRHHHSTPSSPGPMQVDDVFSSPPPGPSFRTSSKDVVMSTPPVSPFSGTLTSNLPPETGGEMERIRQALIEDQLAQIREAEVRRPDYLKRSKRPSLEDPSIYADEKERERGLAVGITESPNKGRRLKLFQETSEESFEESLMAGGYGRYRTNDWVRQPQPLSFPGSSTNGVHSNVAEMMQQVEEAPPLTEKDIKKRKRLEAFRSGSASSRPRSRLYPVVIEGKGRVLLDVPSEDQLGVAPAETPESTPSKKRGGAGGRNRKRKSVDVTGAKEKSGLLVVEGVEGPNWPDNEFPWRLRKEERSEIEKALEEERLKWIERFLDRDSDEEEDEDRERSMGIGEDEEILPSAKWGHVYEDESDKPVPVRMGRGKMVPLLAHPEDPRKAYATKKSVFPSDPADARAALLAKKNVRALAHRCQRRRREVNAEEDKDIVVCICNGKDDGRELVQCDGCQTWYHLDCIGIQNVAELGGEDDPWFCGSCVTRVRSPSPVRDPGPVASTEPTFVPTDDAPNVRRTHDPTLYHPVHESPLWVPPKVPTTPTRGSGRYSDMDLALSSSDSSKFPSTPQNSSHDIRLYHTPGSFDYHPGTTHDLPFDPNTTPSRGIRFGAPLTTPKSNPWSIRGGLFHTPLRHHSRSSFGRSFGSLDEMGGSIGGLQGFTRYNNVEDSPVRRGGSGEMNRLRRTVQSPMRTRGVPHLPLRPGPDESPVVRFGNPQ